MKRVLSFILAVLMCVSLLPLGALAEEVEEVPAEPVEEKTILPEEGAEPAEEEIIPDEDPVIEEAPLAVEEEAAEPEIEESEAEPEAAEEEPVEPEAGREEETAETEAEAEEPAAEALVRTRTVGGVDAAEALLTDGLDAGTYTGTYQQTEARTVLDMVNAFRTGGEAWYWNEDDTTKTQYNVEGGTTLGTLTYDYALEQIAMQRAAEIAVSFSHTRPNGGSCFTCTYDGTQSYGENIAMGTDWYMTAEVVMDGWKETNEAYAGQGHRRNMLKEGYTAIGVACFDYDGTRYWVQEFGYDISGAAAVDPCNSAASFTLDASGDVTVSIEDEPEPTPEPTPEPEIIASGTCGDDLTWTLTDDGVLTISGTGAMEDYDYAPWYSQRSSIKTVVIDDGVTSIGDWAFYDCSSLTSVTIGNSVTSIGDDAFSYCSSLTSVTIGNSVTSIGYAAFFGCSSLTSITIPDSVTSIGDWAFASCSNLTSITVAEGNVYYSSKDGVLFNKSQTELVACPGGISGSYTIPDSVTSIGYAAFSDCSSLTSVTIPDSVTSIGDYAFGYCSSLTSVTIPDSVTSIGGYAFRGCSSLTSVTIPSSVTSIGDYAFDRCSSLTSITIPDSVTSIGSGAFYNCSSLTSITFLGAAPTFGNNVFSNVTATAYYPAGDATWTEDVMQDYGGTITWVAAGASVVIASGTCGEDLTWTLTDDGVLTISGTGAMEDYGGYGGAPWYSQRSSIKAAVIDDGVTSIGDYAFFNCSNLTSITIPDSVTSIGNYAFEACRSLTSIIIPDGVTCIEERAFFNCSSLTSVTIEAGVTSIGDAAFAWCSSLTSITIPSSVTNIEGSVFYGCSSLTSITIPSSMTSIGERAFAWCSSLTSISVAEGNAYYSSKDGVLFNKSQTELVACPGGKSGSYTIPDGVTSIGAWAFEGCSSLTSVTIGNSVTSIGDGTFLGCSSLTSITFLGNAPDIGYSVFFDVTATAHYPAGDATWTEDVMQDYGGTITWVAAGASVVIASGTCGDDLTWTLSDDGVLTISGTGAMEYYGYGGAPWYSQRSSIKTAVIDDSVTSIGDRAFQNCTGLEAVYFPSSLTNIANYAFSGCNVLDDIYYEGDAVAWTAITIGTNNDALSNKEIHFGAEIPDRQAPTAIIRHGELLLALGDSLILDASDSTDNVGIMTYAWDFGDGSTAAAVKTSHQFAATGSYTVTLTLTDYSGNVSRASISVRVIDVNDTATAYTKLVFDICDAVSLNKIEGAQVSLTEGSEQRMLLTDGNGKAALVVPNGSYDVSVCANNYFARTVTIQANGGVQTCQIGLSGSSIMTGSITVTELTYDEIVAAGIDTEAEENQHVYKFAAVLTFVAGIKDYEVPYYVLKNEAGEVVGTSEGGNIHIDPGEGSGFGGWDIVIYPITERFVLIIYGEAHWLKEMYRAELIVNNNSNTDELENVTATIQLPDGMSLAAMVGERQSATQELGTISYSSSATAQWYLRGDKEGDYNISVDVTATTSYGEELHSVYTTANPVHVYAGSALHLHIIADDIAERGKDYTVKFRLENVSDKSIYGLSFGITGMEQFKVIGYGDKEAWLPLDSANYGDAFTREVPELAPGGYVEMELSTTIWFNSVLELIAFTELGSFVDVAYYLTDVTLVTLSGSTTEIPYDYEINHVERDHIVSKIIKELYGLIYPDGDVSYSAGDVLIEIIGEALGADVPVIKGAKTLLKLQKGETDSRLVISIDDGKGTTDSIYNDVVRITTGNSGEAIIDTLNGTKIKCDPGEGKWLSIEGRGPGSTKIKVAIEDDYGRTKREYSFNYVVEDREVSQKVTLSPDEISGKTTVDENTLEATIRRIREDESATYKSNPYMWFDSTLSFEVAGQTADSNVSLTITEKQIKELTDKTAVTNIIIEGKAASLDFPREVLESYAAATDTECTVIARRLSDTEAENLGFSDRTYQMVLTVGSDAIDSFGDQYVYVTLPYELKQNERADDLIVKHIMADGTIETLEAEYDSASETISFQTSGFSYFQIAHENSVLLTGWVQIDGDWYYYENGAMVTNAWKKDSKGWCYLGADGKMVKNAWQKDSKGWCYLGSDGRMYISKWLQDGGAWYYLNDQGYMVTGWQKIGGEWYYFYSPSGKMAAKAWVKDSKGWLYMNASGKITKNAWAKDSVGWCYLGSDGYMVTNKWQKDSKGWCYLGSDGRMYISKWLKDGGAWYYLDENGYMTTGWKQIGGTWYYFYGSGKMATGAVTIGGKTYNFDSNGRCLNP